MTCSFYLSKIAINNSLSWYYKLVVSIRNYDERNTKCFLIDTKQSGRNRSLQYGYDYNDIELNNFKDVNGHVMFYFIKK